MLTIFQQYYSNGVAYYNHLKNAFYLNIFFICNLYMWCKAEFSASLLQSSVSQDPSEIILIYWFAAQETFLIIINVENCFF